MIATPWPASASAKSVCGARLAKRMFGKGNDMAAGTIPLIATTPGIKLLGPLPGDFQSSLAYTALVMTQTAQRDTAEDFIKFLLSPKAKDAFARNGVN
ncbi:MAG TPA: substrate-binding domain-containing protein [Stellaceae bacterium]|nr:substrate-binding domain-containing protein [Stellaceae bacterium]